jgi:CIC family chloride channel protein
MLTTGAAYVLTPRRISIYENQVNSRVDSPAHEGEFVTDALEGIHVRDAMVRDAQLVTFQSNTPLSEILDAVAGSKQNAFPVLNAEGLLHGVIFFGDIRIFFTERGLPARAVVAQDLLAANFTTVTLDEDLASALRKFRGTMREELPVVEAESLRRVAGVLSRRDIIVAYHDRMYQRPKTAPPQ